MFKTLEVNNLVKYFPVVSGFFSRDKRWLRAVDDISLHVLLGETLGIVGESGCGKSTLGRCILRLIEPDAGEVIFEGNNLLKLKKEELRKTRRNLSMIFQDPFSSLSPHMLIKDIVAEPLVVHEVAKGPELEEMVSRLLERVGLAAEHMWRFPHEFSGGQRQRITIARSLALNPKFMVLDEPTSALDVSVQAHILNLLKDIQIERKLSYLFISHNLNVVSYMSNRAAVMYLGKIVELGPVNTIYNSPQHPYTQGLISVVPIPNPELKKNAVPITGSIPSPVDVPSGCRFHPRCVYSDTKCKKEEPQLCQMGPFHFVACHNCGELCESNARLPSHL